MPRRAEPRETARPAPTAMVRRPTVRVRGDIAARLRIGHPWLFRESVDRSPAAASGTEVEIRDEAGEFLARGLFDADSPVCVRVFTTNPDRRIDASLIAERVEAAAQLRSRFTDLPPTAQRVLNGEGDGLPGATCDRFGDFLVVHLYSAALESIETALLDALERRWSPRGIYLQRRYVPMAPGRARPGAERLRGETAPLEVETLEDGATFLADVTAPLAPGLFLDMRDGRRLVRARSSGLRVLNAFSYTGSLSVAAAAGGASRVTSLDLIARSHVRARANFERSGLEPAAHDFLVGDAQATMDRLATRGHRFDLVVLDPPTFAAGKGRPFSALRDYAGLVSRAVRLLDPGGLLFAASNAQRLSTDEFDRALAEGAAEGGTTLQIVERRGQPPDFPAVPALPESSYLKITLAARR